MRKCELRQLGRMGYREAFDLQRLLVEQRKAGHIPDQFLLVEHPHVITLGRNGQMSNLLAGEHVLRRAGVEFEHTDRGGDITYHGPGQIVGYPIFDLREWKRDVVAFVRAIEQALIDALAAFGITAGRMEKCTGVWVEQAKIAAIGVHIGRWITSHGFALNHSTDLSFFQYIVPCGLTRPVTSMEALGVRASRSEVETAIVRTFARLFEFDIMEPVQAEEKLA